MELASDFMRVGDFFVTPTNVDTAPKILITYALSESTLASFSAIDKRVRGKLKFSNFGQINIAGRNHIGMYFYNTIPTEELMELLS